MGIHGFATLMELQRYTFCVVSDVFMVTRYYMDKLLHC